MCSPLLTSKRPAVGKDNLAAKQFIIESGKLLERDIVVSLPRFSVFLGVFSLLSTTPLMNGTLGNPQSAPTEIDSYSTVLHSQSLEEQRAALKQILADPKQYVQRIQQSLRNYPGLLRTDPIAAKRAVYLSALVRDPSFPPILVNSIGRPDVLDDCIYSCPVVFSLTIQACFGGWNPPHDLDKELTAVGDLLAEIHRVPLIKLKVGSIADVIQGPGTDRLREEFDHKSEAQLILIAGPRTPSKETRGNAAFRLETLVTGSKNRIDLYLLALNDFEDGSGEYKGAVYESIYRAELAKARGQ
jgi:hypothetical protein